MKAIETVYNNYKFRSRLEARWAVFFDTLGIKYEYEPEGFDLGDGVWYLPDFRIQAGREFIYWIEIKPKGCYTKPAELEKAVRFDVALWRDYLANYTGPDYPFSTVIVLCGGMGEQEMIQFSWVPFRIWSFANEWVEGFELNLESRQEFDEMLIQQFGLSSDLIERAYTAARQARFEHGETPNGKS